MLACNGEIMRMFDKFISGRMRPKLIECTLADMNINLAKNTCYLELKDSDGKVMRIFMNAEESSKLEKLVKVANAGIRE
jgi:hypothetical protein